MGELKRILLADDNANDVELTLHAFSKHNLGNQVEVVNDGAEAIDYLFRKGRYADYPKGNPCLVVLDLKMPKVNGLEVLQKIRETPELKLIPVILLTSSKVDGDITLAYEKQANGYIVKPVEFKDFVRAVSEIGLFWGILNEPPPGSVGGK